MPPASILSLSYPVISTCSATFCHPEQQILRFSQDDERATRPSSNGNVRLPTAGGKLRNHFYNPLQSKEFRVNYMIRRLIGRLARL